MKTNKTTTYNYLMYNVIKRFKNKVDEINAIYI